MAVTIKLKNASGSDPSASDLVVGEIAIRTDTAKLFTKKDDNSVAEIGATVGSDAVDTAAIQDDAVTQAKIAAGAVGRTEIATAAISSDEIDAGQVTTAKIGDLAVSTAKLGNDAVTSAKIADDSINSEHYVDGSIDTAHIADDQVTYAKIQNVSATNRILGRDSSGAGVIEEITPANLRTMLNVADGATNVTNTNQLTNGAGFITATLTNEQVQDIVGGMVTGNTESGITVTYQDGDGTLDFSVASQTDNNFTNADHSKLDGIEAGATADQTASEILTLIKTVDGAGSGLDADTLDGISSASFLRSDANDTTTGNITFGSSTNEKIVLAGSSNPYIRWQEGTTDKAYIQWNANGYLDLVNQETNDGLRIQSGSNGLKYRIDGTSYNVWHQANDGSGSGLDADSVDGIAGSSLLRSDTADTASGDITFSGGAGAVTVSAASDIRIAGGTWTGEYTGGIKIQPDANNAYIQYHGVLFFRDEGSTNNFQLNQSGDATFTGSVLTTRVSLSNGILETKAAIANSHTITADYNALAVSPTINSGVTVTVPSGAVWAIV